MSTARAPRRDEVVLAAAGRVIKQVAARFARGWGSLDKDELEAVAWEACLAAWDGYNPETGPAEAYFHVIARRAMARFCGRLVAKVSLGKHAAEQGKNHQTAVDVTTWTGDGVHHGYLDVVEEQVEAARPDRRLAAAAEEAEREDKRQRVRTLLDGVLCEWDKWDRYVAFRLHGLDGWRAEKPRELAERLKVPVQRVYRIHARLEREIWNVPALYLLAKEF